MMWMLVTVMCMASGPEARCEKHVRPPMQDRADCLALMGPMKEYLEAVAVDTQADLIFLSVRCEPGRDS